MQSQNSHDPRSTERSGATLLSWFPLAYASLVGGPTIASLTLAILNGEPLSAPIRSALESYKVLSELATILLQPALLLAAQGVIAVIGGDVEMNPQWKPLFFLGSIPIIGLCRLYLWDGNRRQAALVSFVLGITLLSVALGVALVPERSHWISQGLIAFIPVFGLTLLYGPTIVQNDRLLVIMSGGRGFLAVLMLLFSMPVALAAGAAAFAVGAILAKAEIHSSFAGIISFMAFLLVFAWWNIRTGRNYRLSSLARARKIGESNFRLGLLLMGGFATAALLLIGDFVISAIA